MIKNKKNKYYVVWIGKKEGIYFSRNECKFQVYGYPGAKYKSYEKLKDAKKAFIEGYNVSSKNFKNKANIISLIKLGIISGESICVDAACENNPGILEWRGIETNSGYEIFHSSKYPIGTINIGEWLAIIQGIHRLMKHGKIHWTIYSDSRIAINWFYQGTIRTTLMRDEYTESLWQAIDKGKKWLQTHKSFIKNIKLIKWNTSKRGEIPADFGRK